MKVSEIVKMNNEGESASMKECVENPSIPYIKEFVLFAAGRKSILMCSNVFYL